MDQLIQELKTKISRNRDNYNRNETAVRRQLIEPMLDHLGWRTDDPDFVGLNSQTDERDIPDYTLIRQERTETYVEAKNLSANIQEHISQLARYCVHQGIEYGILTNGCDWLLIKTFEKDIKLRDRIIWQISVEKDAIAIIKSRLATISYDQIIKLSELIEKEKQLNKFWVEFILDQNKFADKLVTEISAQFLDKYADEDFDIEAINSFFKSKLFSLLSEKAAHDSANNDGQNIRQIRKDRTNNYNIYGLQRAGTPSVRDWLDSIPELSKIKGLNSWRNICDHLNIDVGRDSARRRLKKWAESNKPNWTKIPEPTK